MYFQTIHCDKTSAELTFHIVIQGIVRDTLGCVFKQGIVRDVLGCVFKEYKIQECSFLGKGIHCENN
jgi:hypothetical protein